MCQLCLDHMNVCAAFIIDGLIPMSLLTEAHALANDGKHCHEFGVDFLDAAKAEFIAGSGAAR